MGVQEVRWEVDAGRIFVAVDLLVQADTGVAVAAYIALEVTGHVERPKVLVDQSNNRLPCQDHVVELSEVVRHRDRRNSRVAAAAVADVAFQNSMRTLYAFSPADPSCHAA